MSYLDFYHKNIENGNLHKDVIKGTCLLMCPAEEIAMRVKSRLVHGLESGGGDAASSSKLVKCYSRSAADTNRALPQLLRPFPVLNTTVHYLLFEVTQRARAAAVPASVVYDFINDRLRAVRQDMIVQRLPDEECAVLLEPMVRFHVYFGYKLGRSPLCDFDPVLNKKYLLECIKWYLNCCDAIEMQCHSIEDEEKHEDSTTDSLQHLVSNMNINESENRLGLCNDRVLVECVYILCHLNDVHPILSNPRLRLAYTMAMSNLKGNYVRVSRAASQLACACACPLSRAAYSLSLPPLQRQTLLVMSAAYSAGGGGGTVPLDAVAWWAGWESRVGASGACAHYGLRTTTNNVHFIRGSFRGNVALYRGDAHAPDDTSLCDINDAHYMFSYKGI